VLLHGACLLVPPEGDPVHLSTGDLVFLRQGSHHTLCSDPAVPPEIFTAARVDRTDHIGRIVVGGPGDRTVLACGAYRLDVARPIRCWRDCPQSSTGGLAQESGLSRAAFARRFTAVVGEPPLGYLTSWRMTTAGRLLRETSAPLATITQRTGYSSEFAFAKAFKRENGTAPGSYRRRARPAI
jgi:AraC-like DNA-binding protein